MATTAVIPLDDPLLITIVVIRTTRVRIIGLNQLILLDTRVRIFLLHRGNYYSMSDRYYGTREPFIRWLTMSVSALARKNRGGLANTPARSKPPLVEYLPKSY
jgi:hypothetical protein